MKAALIGLPQSGKSTVFSAVTGKAADPYASPEPKHAVVKVPDERLDFLSKLVNPKKYTEATIDFVDIPGVALNDPKGRDDWRRLLPEVRKAEVLVVVVREFADPSVPMYQDRIDARADLAVVWDELVFADLEAVTNRVEKLAKSIHKPTKTQDADKKEHALLLKCQAALEAGEPLSNILTHDDERRDVSSFSFVTDKPIVVVRNISDDVCASRDEWDVPHAQAVMTLKADIESEIAQLPAEDRPAFMEEMGLSESALDRLIQICYDACGLISFLTMGPEEVRAWTIPRGATAQEAAGKIHSDLARGFIRAETVAYDDLVAHEGMKGAKAAGRARKEGKTYVVQDGDVLLILANT